MDIELHNRIEALEEHVATLLRELRELRQDHQEFRTSVEAFIARQDEHNRKLGAAISSVSARIGAVEGRVSAVEERVTAVESAVLSD